MLHSLMGRLTSAQKEEVQARIDSFDFSGLDTKLSYNLCRHFRSFIGRDFKTIAQCALFLLGPYMTPSEKLLWMSLSKVYSHTQVHIFCYNPTVLQVFKITYCQPFRYNSCREYQQVCENFVRAVKDNSPELLKKVKIHLILHLVESMSDFGPSSAFNTER